MDQTATTDTTATNATVKQAPAEAPAQDQKPSDQKPSDAEVQELQRREAFDKAKQEEAKQEEVKSADIPAAEPPVGTPVAEAQAEALEQPEGLDADKETAGRVDEAQATKDIEDAAGYRGVRTDPTPHSHYTVSGVNAGLPTPETNADAAFLTGNTGRYAHLSEDEKYEHHNAEGIDEVAERAKKLGLV